MVKVDTKWFSTDLWLGKYLQYKSDVWPDRSIDDFLTLVSYSQVKKLPFRLDVFYVLKSDTSGKVAGESGAGNLRSHTIGFQAEGQAFASSMPPRRSPCSPGVTGTTPCGRSGRTGSWASDSPGAGKPRLGGQYTWGSGDSDPADGVHGTFDGVYGGRDIFFYGYLNLFFWANLRDAEIDLSCQATPHGRSERRVPPLRPRPADGCLVHDGPEAVPAGPDGALWDGSRERAGRSGDMDALASPRADGRLRPLLPRRLREEHGARGPGPLVLPAVHVFLVRGRS